MEEKEKEPETRIIVRRKPVEPEIEDIVVQERKPRRQRTVVYDEPIPQPRPQPRPQPQRILVPIEPPPEPRPVEQEVVVRKPDEGDTRRVISHVYDEGRFAAQPEVRPPRDPSPVIVERHYVTNPNFAKPAPNVHRYAEEPPAPVFVQRERPVYATQAVVRGRDLVYSENPRVYSERRHVPTGSKYRVYREERSPVRKTRFPPRARAHSADGRDLFAANRSRVYPGEVQRVVHYVRPRAYSDERPRDYDVVKPRVFAGENTAPAMQARPAAFGQQPYPDTYDKQLENSLQTADKWAPRPSTPY